MTTQTMAIMSVTYTEGRGDSYQGMTLAVSYGYNTAPGGDGAAIVETATFASGNGFKADYYDAVNFFLGLPGVTDEAGDVQVPLMGSSTVDSYQYDSGEVLP